MICLVKVLTAVCHTSGSRDHQAVHFSHTAFLEGSVCAGESRERTRSHVKTIPLRWKGSHPRVVCMKESLLNHANSQLFLDREVQGTAQRCRGGWHWSVAQYTSSGKKWQTDIMGTAVLQDFHLLCMFLSKQVLSLLTNIVLGLLELLGLCYKYYIVILNCKCCPASQFTLESGVLFVKFDKARCRGSYGFKRNAFY